ncbi:MFS transporter [Chloroflexota bacterium]
MVKSRSYSKIFFGWRTVIITGILSGLGHGFYGLGVSALFKPVASELNFSRASTSVAAGIGRLEGSIEAPLTGWLVDKYGPRWVIFAGICIAATGLPLMYFINSLWAYYLVWGLIMGTGINLALTIAVDKTLTNWFIIKRGLAQGIKFAIIGIVGVIVLPIITWQVAEQGWRITCLIWGGIMFASAPFALLFVKQKRPEYYGLLPDGAKIASDSEANVDGMIDKGVEYAASFQEVEFTLRQALRTPAYWMLLASFAGHTMVYGAFYIHCIPFLTDIGIDATTAGAMMGLMVFFTVPARFLGGIVSDRVRKNRMQFLLAAAFLFQAVGIGVFCLNQSIAMVYVLLILYGFGSGAATPLYLLILGRYFGRKAFGSIHGSTNLFRAPVQIAAPVYAGWVYDTTGSYMTAFIIFAALAGFSAIIMCIVRPPETPAHITDIHKFL